MSAPGGLGCNRRVNLHHSLCFGGGQVEIQEAEGPTTHEVHVAPSTAAILKDIKLSGGKTGPGQRKRRAGFGGAAAAEGGDGAAAHPHSNLSVLWLRLDPLQEWLADTHVRQNVEMWALQMELCRDLAAQVRKGRYRH